MKLNRLTLVALCLGAALIFMTGSAVAGTTTFTALKFAREVGSANATYTLPTAAPTHAMTLSFSNGDSFFIYVTLDTAATTPAKWMTIPSGAMAVAVAAGGAGGSITCGNTPYTAIASSGSQTLIYACSVSGGAVTTQPTATFTATGGTIKDVANTLGGGSTITITIATYNSFNVAIDSSSADTVNFLTGTYAVSVSPAVSGGAATIDVVSNRKNFVTATNVTTTSDASGSLGVLIGLSSGTVYGLYGNAYTLSSLSSIQLTFTPSTDYSGIKKAIWDPSGVATSSSTSPFTINISGGSASLSGTLKYIEIDVDGTTALATRTIAVTVTFNPGGVSATGGDGPTANTRTLQSSITLTTWTMNGTVLNALWLNGNNASFNSRIYLWNPSSVSGTVTASVYTLPTGMGGSTLLGTVSLGTLPATSATNIRLAEDILTPLAIALPYTTNGGNLLVSFTINASSVEGASNVFSSSFSYGIIQLWKQ